MMTFFASLTAFPQARLARFGLRRGLAALAAIVLLGVGYAIVLAQVSGDRGIAPTASSVDIDITGIEVDVRADTGEEARQEAWREAQRKAWEKAGGPAISDRQLEGLVSAIVIEKERIAPRRYIATLGVIFDRQRAGSYLGGEAQERSSAPMLLIPVMATGGTYITFEVRNPWQRAWAEFNPGSSRVDYVRPSGAGGDSLLLNFGQTGRRSRAWWRSTLDQYGAADAVMPIAKLDYRYPGGPIAGSFIARYGPDNRVLESFELEADGPEQLQAMLGEAVRRMDAVYEKALEQGKLQPDPTLRLGGGGQVDPALARLIEIGRAVRARNAAERRAAEARQSAASEPEPAQEAPDASEQAEVRAITVQFASPDVGAFDAALSGVRGAPGVRSLSVTSTAMGGTSVMSVSFAGSAEELAGALRARGFVVQSNGAALSISR